VTLDLALEGSEAHITWRSEAFGVKRTPLTLRYDSATLPVVLRALNVLQIPSYPNPQTEELRHAFTFSAAERRALANVRLWERERIPADASRRVGVELFHALGPDGEALLQQARNAASTNGQSINYIMRLPPEALALAMIPWELLWDDRWQQPVLIRGNMVDSLERHIDLDMALPPLRPAGSRLHALALTPRYGLTNEQRSEERAARRQSWDALRAEGLLTYDELDLITVPRVNDYLRDAPRRPDIVNYFGHGSYRDGQGVLWLDDGMGGREEVSTAQLAPLLGGARLVVLHACESGAVRSEGGLLTGLGPALSLTASAVVAMQFNVSTLAATRFAEVLYDQLLRRRQSLQVAVASARQVLFTESSAASTCWYVPALFLRARAFQPLFLLTPEPPALDEPAPSAHDESVPSKGPAGTTGTPAGVPVVRLPSEHVNRTALRRELLAAYDRTRLSLLCADISERLRQARVGERVDLDIVGGDKLEKIILNLIEYLDRRGWLQHLLDAACALEG